MGLNSSAWTASLSVTLGEGLIGPIRTSFEDLQADFADPDSQGPQAYADQMLVDQPERDPRTLLADAVTAVDEFCRLIRGHTSATGTLERVPDLRFHS